jgi:hypothetical protein
MMNGGKSWFIELFYLPVPCLRCKYPKGGDKSWVNQKAAVEHVKLGVV